MMAAATRAAATAQPASLSAHVTIAPAQLLGPEAGAFVAAPDRLAAWAQAAAEGERCIYARAVTLRRHAETAELARGLGAAGIVTLWALRHAPSGPLFDYHAKRTLLPVEAAAPPPADEDALAPNERLLLDMMARQADRGAPASSNREYARAIGLKTGDQVKTLINRLRHVRGLIVVAAAPVPPGRTITIVETGAKTGLVGRSG